MKIKDYNDLARKWPLPISLNLIGSIFKEIKLQRESKRIKYIVMYML
jgi:hypothetical protein